MINPIRVPEFECCVQGHSLACTVGFLWMIPAVLSVILASSIAKITKSTQLVPPCKSPPNAFGLTQPLPDFSFLLPVHFPLSHRWCVRACVPAVRPRQAPVCWAALCARRAGRARTCAPSGCAKEAKKKKKKAGEGRCGSVLHYDICSALSPTQTKCVVWRLAPV